VSSGCVFLQLLPPPEIKPSYIERNGNLVLFLIFLILYRMRKQDEYLTSFCKDLRREASGSNELGSAAALGELSCYSFTLCLRLYFRLVAVTFPRMGIQYNNKKWHGPNSKVILMIGQTSLLELCYCSAIMYVCLSKRSQLTELSGIILKFSVKSSKL
jgi:hypothetical protein